MVNDINITIESAAVGQGFYMYQITPVNNGTKVTRPSIIEQNAN